MATPTEPTKEEVQQLQLTKIASAALQLLRVTVARLPDAHRVILFAKVAEGYCTSCGRYTQQCYCKMDE